ncbi:Fic family protein [Candidatus Shapirobacteria bacterium CG08_land_8_20_14_0_20_39_18]|uniref:Fic family protein n=1 Tax=Candidatus Shapirobacteria bacterium CG08_land_8_20_14_0_20_39_18 TaxID=1974883 RepID=A0A2M6XCV2_9BACT|nr:MAG: Fic family protein [Candidatus Shapirobacteria bacterium CG08_land_8_20_14_0_20_39_18]PIY65131.1 MAG: Fic family protein [Candidatus Shapirobacteria bacterium CG_4_10_14_0_8_um_filter_39_15]
MNDKLQEKLKTLTEKKKELDKQKPLTAEVLKNLEGWLKVELTYSSNAIEGNTLTRLETAEVIEKGISAALTGKSLQDQLEAINHAKAVEFIKTLAKEEKSHQFITEQDIKAIHKIILTGINDEWAGRYRESDMTEFIQWLETQQNIHPFRVAADAHFKFVSIHPFVDGNGRTARLLMNLILIINGYPMAIIRNENRTEYLDAVNTGQTKGNLEMFYAVIEEAEERSLDAYLNAARGKPVIPVLMGKDKETKLLKIGELAQAARETKPTIRFWTKEGLLEIAKLTKAGYALYDSKMIERVKEIRRLQNEERLSIAEIKNRPNFE